MLLQSEESVQALQSVRMLFDVVFVAAVVGAILDRRYKRAGGARPIRKHWIFLFVGGIVLAALLALLGFTGADPEWLGRRVFDSALLLFISWEFSRWWVRRSHPLNRTRPS